MNNMFKKGRKIILGLLVVLVGFSLIWLALGNKAPVEKKEVHIIPIRVGWQTAWAVQGQLAQTLQHTNILELNGLKGEFKGFTFGSPLNEAALAGEVDVIFTGEQPAVNLIAKSDKWVIIARLFNTRLGMIVPYDSNINDVKDLSGKEVAMPFGSTAHRLGLKWLQEAGLNTQTDVKISNIDIAEQSSIVQSSTNGLWQGKIAALLSWDPNIAVFENKKLAKLFKYEVAPAYVVMSSDYINNHPVESVAFLRSFIYSYYYYANNQPQANQWFASVANIKFDPSLLDVAASFEPNLKGKNIEKMDISVKSEHMKSLEDAVVFGYDNKIIKNKPDIKNFVNSTLLDQAYQEVKENSKDLSLIKVIN